MSGRRGAAAGFTLIEVVVALTLLGAGVFILLQSHYGTMNLFITARDSAMEELAVGQALANAEREVLSGETQGGGEIGAAFEGYSYSFSAEQQDETETPGLFEVTVSVTGPNLEREVNYLVYHGAQIDVGQ
jgi:prepilin-type N-terminal cleavage/methylation domain-containing protein